MTIKTIRLNPLTSQLLDTFDQAAQTWGWQCDQGSGRAVGSSEHAYINADAALRLHISRLEQQLRAMKKRDRAMRKPIGVTRD